MDLETAVRALREALNLGRLTGTVALDWPLRYYATQFSLARGGLDSVKELLPPWASAAARGPSANTSRWPPGKRSHAEIWSAAAGACARAR